MLLAGMTWRLACFIFPLSQTADATSRGIAPSAANLTFSHSRTARSETSRRPSTSNLGKAVAAQTLRQRRRR